MPQDVEPAVEQALSAASPGRGQTVLLSGPPGCGISRRLSQAAGLARDRGMHVAIAHGRPAERSLAFSVAVELFEPLWQAAASTGLRAELAGGPGQAALRLLDAVEAPSLQDGGFAVTRGMWVLAQRLADLPASMPPASVRGHRAGLAVIVDDLHDADGPTLGLLAYMAGRLSASPISIVAGGRIDVEPVAPSAAAAIARAATLVTLEPLAADRGAALVGSLLPGASPLFSATCVTACGGNPALIHALVRGLAARGLTGSDQEADRVGAGVPVGVAALASERLSRLPAAACAILRSVAASDRAVGLEQIAAGAGLSIDAALDALDLLVTADLLVAEPQPAFAQPIMRAAVRASLSPGQRARLAPVAAAPPAVARERIDSLTPGEQRVAGLAAHGMTTRQIAETLFVTPKTVEFHLRNVYAKLEIASTRAALAQALDVPEPVRSAE